MLYIWDIQTTGCYGGCHKNRALARAKVSKCHLSLPLLTVPAEKTKQFEYRRGFKCARQRKYIAVFNLIMAVAIQNFSWVCTLRVLNVEQEEFITLLY